jgi:hypothetical protein
MMSVTKLIKKVRILFRLIEFGGGVYSSITTHVQATEAYQYTFDSTLMFLAMVTVHHPHPGTIMVGADVEPPYGKAKRAIKTERKEESRRIRAAKKEAKEALKPARTPWDHMAEIELGTYARLTDVADSIGEVRR